MNCPCPQNQAPRGHIPARQAGMSLLEIMVALLLVAIITAMAIPGYGTMVKNNKLDTVSSSLVSILNLARSEAVKSNNSVFLCAGKNTSADPTAPNLVCETDATAGKKWQAGDYVFMFRDSDNNGTITPAQMKTDCTGTGSDCRLEMLTSEDFPEGVTIHVAAAGFLRIRSDGGPPSQRVFNICDDRGTSDGKSVTISSSGRISVSKGAAACS